MLTRNGQVPLCPLGVLVLYGMMSYCTERLQWTSATGIPSVGSLVHTGCGVAILTQDLLHGSQQF
jgi:hypothetical protein